MQPKWMVIEGRAEFASRYAAFVFAERLEGSYYILRGPAQLRKARKTRSREGLRTRSKRLPFSDHIPPPSTSERAAIPSPRSCRRTGPKTPSSQSGRITE